MWAFRFQLTSAEYTGRCAPKELALPADYSACPASSFSFATLPKLPLLCTSHSSYLGCSVHTIPEIVVAPHISATNWRVHLRGRNMCERFRLWVDLRKGLTVLDLRPRNPLLHLVPHCLEKIRIYQPWNNKINGKNVMNWLHWFSTVQFRLLWSGFCLDFAFLAGIFIQMVSNGKLISHQFITDPRQCISKHSLSPSCRRKRQLLQEPWRLWSCGIAVGHMRYRRKCGNLLARIRFQCGIVLRSI